MKHPSDEPLSSQILDLLLSSFDDVDEGDAVQTKKSEWEQEEEADLILKASRQIMEHSLTHRQWLLATTGGKEQTWEANEIDEEMWDSLQESLWESWTRKVQMKWSRWWSSFPQEPAKQAALLWQTPLSSSPGGWNPRSLTAKVPNENMSLFAMFVPIQSSLPEPNSTWTPKWENGKWSSTLPAQEPLVFRCSLQEQGFISLLLFQENQEAEPQFSLLYPLKKSQDFLCQPGIFDLFYYRFLEPGNGHFLLLHSPTPVSSWLHAEQWNDENQSQITIPLCREQWQEALLTTEQGFPLSIQVLKAHL